MALYTYTDFDLVVPLSNRVVGSLEVKRKARVGQLIVEPIQKQIRVTLIVDYYALGANDSYGSELSELIPSYEKHIVHNHTSLVDIDTGVVICKAEELNNLYIKDEEGNDTEEENPDSPLYGRTFMYQIQWEMMIIKYVPMNVSDTIIGAIQNADDNGELD